MAGASAAAPGAGDTMADLTPLDEKLAEVLGLAQAAQSATAHVAEMDGADAFEDQLERMRDEAQETDLKGEEEALDGFEFLTMAEAGELGHWEIVRAMGKTLSEPEVVDLADWAVDIQSGHFDGVRASSVALAEDEARG